MPPDGIEHWGTDSRTIPTTTLVPVGAQLGHALLPWQSGASGSFVPQPVLPDKQQAYDFFQSAQRPPKPQMVAEFLALIGGGGHPDTILAAGGQVCTVLVVRLNPMRILVSRKGAETEPRDATWRAGLPELLRQIVAEFQAPRLTGTVPEPDTQVTSVPLRALSRYPVPPIPVHETEDARAHIEREGLRRDLGKLIDDATLDSACRGVDVSLMRYDDLSGVTLVKVELQYGLGGRDAVSKEDEIFDRMQHLMGMSTMNRFLVVVR